jgi:hypothetical protein
VQGSESGAEGFATATVWKHIEHTELRGIHLLRLSEKYFEQRSNPGFCRYSEHKLGQRGIFSDL